MKKGKKQRDRESMKIDQKKNLSILITTITSVFEVTES
jgi:hypothetical protein